MKPSNLYDLFLEASNRFPPHLPVFTIPNIGSRSESAGTRSTSPTNIGRADKEIEVFPSDLRDFLNSIT